ncbi:hypothetical protein TNCV_4615411 [Trichonephila clavipes]|nr:hypothetical protein TNCV_4615411 [Trichonephila clavipes]
MGEGVPWRRGGEREGESEEALAFFVTHFHVTGVPEDILDHVLQHVVPWKNGVHPRRTKIQRVKTGGPRTLQRRNRQRKPQRRNHQRSLASLKNNFTEQLTDDEDEDSAPFSLESTNDANKQPLTPPIYHLPSPQDVLFPSLKDNEIKAKEGTKRMYFC